MAACSQDKHLEKYASLMNPIRDLAKNFNVDVASMLEMYKSELEYLKIAFDEDPNSDTMNFVEAALLIQNSACVYSKKVDYLFNLVVQLLDHLKCKSTNPASSKKGVVIRNVKSGDDFLSYNDLLPEKNIRLKESGVDVLDMNAFSITRKPLEFLSFEKSEKSFPLYNIKNELIGNRHDFKLNCWQSPFYKSICADLAKNNNAIVSDIDQSVPQENLNSLRINETLKDEPIIHDENHYSDDGGGDFSHSDIDDKGEDDDDQQQRSKCNKTEAPRSDLAMAAEKALKEWDPLYPHDNIKQRLRPARKGKVILKPCDAKTIYKKKSTKTIAAFCNRRMFSRAAKLPSSIAKEAGNAESLTDIFYKEHVRRKELQMKNGEKNSGDGEETQNEEDDAIDDDFQAFSNSDIENDDQPSPNTTHDFNRRQQFDSTFDAFISKQTEEYLEKILDQKEVSESELVKKKWEEYLSQKLEDEDEYDAYDVREYCTKVLKAFNPKPSKQAITFTQVATGDGVCKRTVSRLFFATLQLANNYNIKIMSNSTEELDSDTLELVLLSRKQNFEAFDNENN